MLNTIKIFFYLQGNFPGAAAPAPAPPVPSSTYGVPPPPPTFSGNNLFPDVNFPPSVPQAPSGLYETPFDDSNDVPVVSCNPETRVSVLTTTQFIPTTVVQTRTRALPTTIYSEITQTQYYPSTVLQPQVVTSVVPPVIQTTTEVSDKKKCLVIMTQHFWLNFTQRSHKF